jgi:hypothetical protein
MLPGPLLVARVFQVVLALAVAWSLATAAVAEVERAARQAQAEVNGAGSPHERSFEDIVRLLPGGHAARS